MSKKIIVIMGSPHISGNISQALNAVVRGAEEYGASCTQYDLCKLNIKNCLGCRKCIENGGICVLQDDMKQIFEDIKTADILLIGSPIYINQVNGYVKTFLDRMYPLTDSRHRPRFGKRRLYMLYTYGVPIPFMFGRYIRATGKSLKAMGLLIQKNIVIHGCTTIDKVKTSDALLKRLYNTGCKIAQK